VTAASIPYGFMRIRVLEGRWFCSWSSSSFRVIQNRPQSWSPPVRCPWPSQRPRTFIENLQVGAVGKDALALEAGDFGNDIQSSSPKSQRASAPGTQPARALSRLQWSTIDSTCRLPAVWTAPPWFLRPCRFFSTSGSCC